MKTIKMRTLSLIIFFISAFYANFCLTGCNTIKGSNSPPNLFGSNNFIVPGRGVGDLNVGMNVSQIISILGTPDEECIYDSGQVIYLNYFEKGISFLLEPDHVKTIFFYSGRIGGYVKGEFKRFPGVVNERIDFDTTYEDVIKEYGPPQDGDDLIHAPIPSRWISYDIGIGFDFIIKTEEIIIISIQKKK